MRTWRSHKHDNKSPAGRHADVSKDVSGFRSNSVSLFFPTMYRYFFRTHSLAVAVAVVCMANHVSQFPPYTRSRTTLYFIIYVYLRTLNFSRSRYFQFLLCLISLTAQSSSRRRIEPLHKLLTCELTPTTRVCSTWWKIYIEISFFLLNLFFSFSSSDIGSGSHQDRLPIVLLSRCDNGFMHIWLAGCYEFPCDYTLSVWQHGRDDDEMTLIKCFSNTVLNMNSSFNPRCVAGSSLTLSPIELSSVCGGDVSCQVVFYWIFGRQTYFLPTTNDVCSHKENFLLFPASVRCSCLCIVAVIQQQFIFFVPRNKIHSIFWYSSNSAYTKLRMRQQTFSAALFYKWVGEGEIFQMWKMWKR